jgi:hypothetical protein
MSQIIVDEEQIKALLKQALVEVLQERKDVLYDVLAEVIEDLALVEAIQEGERTETVSKEDVLQALEDTLEDRVQE